MLLTAGPADKDSLVVIQMCYIGPKEQGLEYLQALSSWTGEQCLLNEVHEKSFLSQQDSVAQVLRGRRGNQWFIRSALISSLPDEVINKTVLEFADTPVGCSESPSYFFLSWAILKCGVCLSRQLGSLNLRLGLSRTMKRPASPRHSARPSSRLRRYTSGKWVLMILVVFLAPKT